jgi:hypothetical protein
VRASIAAIVAPMFPAPMTMMSFMPFLRGLWPKMIRGDVDFHCQDDDMTG